MKHIGIVGVSAEGAALCYRTICSGSLLHHGDWRHPEITLHTLPLDRYMEAADRDDWDRVGELMLESAAVLQKAGADFVICPDNTVHQGLDTVRERSPLPWLHISEVVAEQAVEEGFGTVGILGTRWLMEGPVYPRALEARGIGYEIPDSASRQAIDDMIFGELVLGRLPGWALRSSVKQIRALRDQGCEAVVLGCTELPLLISAGDSPLPVLDSTRLLARAALVESLDLAA